jgi:hypothetical protein
MLKCYPVNSISSEALASRSGAQGSTVCARQEQRKNKKGAKLGALSLKLIRKN